MDGIGLHGDNLELDGNEKGFIRWWKCVGDVWRFKDGIKMYGG